MNQIRSNLSQSLWTTSDTIFMDFDKLKRKKNQYPDNLPIYLDKRNYDKANIFVL